MHFYNKTANIIVSSYYTTGYESDYKLSDDFDPYPEGIYVYDNRFEDGGDSPDRKEG